MPSLGLGLQRTRQSAEAKTGMMRPALILCNTFKPSGSKGELCRSGRAQGAVCAFSTLEMSLQARALAIETRVLLAIVSQQVCQRFHGFFPNGKALAQALRSAGEPLLRRETWGDRLGLQVGVAAARVQLRFSHAECTSLSGFPCSALFRLGWILVWPSASATASPAAWRGALRCSPCDRIPHLCPAGKAR